MSSRVILGRSPSANAMDRHEAHIGRRYFRCHQVAAALVFALVASCHVPSADWKTSRSSSRSTAHARGGSARRPRRTQAGARTCRNLVRARGDPRDGLARVSRMERCRRPTLVIGSRPPVFSGLPFTTPVRAPAAAVIRSGRRVLDHGADLGRGGETVSGGNPDRDQGACGRQSRPYPRHGAQGAGAPVAEIEDASPARRRSCGFSDLEADDLAVPLRPGRITGSKPSAGTVMPPSRMMTSPSTMIRCNRSRSRSTSCAASHKIAGSGGHALGNGVRELGALRFAREDPARHESLVGDQQRRDARQAPALGDDRRAAVHRRQGDSQDRGRDRPVGDAADQVDHAVAARRCRAGRVSGARSQAHVEPGSADRVSGASRRENRRNIADHGIAIIERSQPLIHDCRKSAGRSENRERLR